MGIGLFLRHRATLRRATHTTLDWETVYAWGDVATGVRCLLSLNGFQNDEVNGVESDSTGVLFLPPDTTAQVGDHVVMTTGPAGTYELGTEPRRASDLHGVHHVEWPCFEVSP